MQAVLTNLLPRLRGWGESMSRQAGGQAAGGQGMGSRGPGETKIELDRRRAAEDAHAHLHAAALEVELLHRAVEAGEGSVRDADRLADLEGDRGLRAIDALGEAAGPVPQPARAMKKSERVIDPPPSR
mgnify:CR=1 FL=1